MGVVQVRAEKKMFFPGAISPSYLNGSLAGDYGWDPLGFGADPVALKWYRQVGSLIPHDPCQSPTVSRLAACATPGLAHS
jgi:hypothetical protein